MLHNHKCLGSVDADIDNRWSTIFDDQNFQFYRKQFLYNQIPFVYYYRLWFRAVIFQIAAKFHKSPRSLPADAFCQNVANVCQVTYWSRCSFFLSIIPSKILGFFRISLDDRDMTPCHHITDTDEQKNDYNDVIMSMMSSQITGISIVCSTVGSDADQRNHQSSASLAFVRGLHRWPMNSPHKGPVTRKMYSFDAVITYINTF